MQFLIFICRFNAICGLKNLREKKYALEAFVYKASRASKKVGAKLPLKTT
jgi:hypothetical protein